MMREATNEEERGGEQRGNEKEKQGCHRRGGE